MIHTKQCIYSSSHDSNSILLAILFPTFFFSGSDADKSEILTQTVTTAFNSTILVYYASHATINTSSTISVHLLTEHHDRKNKKSATTEKWEP